MYFRMDRERKKDTLEKLEWAIVNLCKEDRILWFLGIVRSYHLCTWKPEGKSRALPSKDLRRLKFLMQSSSESQMISEYRKLENEFMQNWEHYRAIEKVYNSRTLRKMSFHRIESGKQKPMLVNEVLQNLDQIEHSLAENSSARFCDDGEEFINLKDGWKWVRVEEGYSRQEGMAMSHCGNGNGRPGQVLHSLRQPVPKKGKVRWKPHLTFISNQGGFFGEMKGKGNQKPKSIYNEKVAELFKQKEFRGVHGGGYLPRNNFDPGDLSTDLIGDIMIENPRFDFGLFNFEKTEILHRFSDGWDLAFDSGNCNPERPKQEYRKNERLPKVALRKRVKTKRGSIFIPCLILPFVQGYLGKPILERNQENERELVSKFKKMIEVIHFRGVSSGCLLSSGCPWPRLLGLESAEQVVRSNPRFASATPVVDLAWSFGPGQHLVHSIAFSLGVDIERNERGNWNILHFRSIRRFLKFAMDYPTLKSLRESLRGSLGEEKKRLKKRVLERINSFEFGHPNLRLVLQNPESLVSECFLETNDWGLARISTDINFTHVKDPKSMVEQLVRTYDYQRLSPDFLS